MTLSHCTHSKHHLASHQLQLQLRPVTETLRDKRQTGDTSEFVRRVSLFRRQYFKNEHHSEKTEQIFSLTTHNFTWTVNGRKFHPEKQNRAVKVTQMTVGPAGSGPRPPDRPAPTVTQCGNVIHPC